MIRPIRTTLVLLAIALVRPASAQLIGPIPPAPAPARAHAQPGGTPAEVKPPPGEPDAPSIVEHENGRLKPLASTPDEAAVARYPFDEARRARIAASLKARAADLDRFVVANLDHVLEAQTLEPQVLSAGDFNTLFRARDTVAALRFERPLDRLLRDGAITLEHKTRLDEAVREYETARKRQNDADAAGDPTRAAILARRRTLAGALREPLASLARQLATFGPHADAVLGAITLRQEQQPAAGKLRSVLARAASPDERSAALVQFWKSTLDAEQKRAALTAARAAAAAPTTPTTPTPAAPGAPRPPAHPHHRRHPHKRRQALRGDRHERLRRDRNPAGPILVEPVGHVRRMRHRLHPRHIYLSQAIHGGQHRREFPTQQLDAILADGQPREFRHPADLFRRQSRPTRRRAVVWEPPHKHPARR